MLRRFRKVRLSQQTHDGKRRGGFMVLASICLVAGMAFVSLCVDIGYLSLSKQRMQNAVDAAAIAAAMEITNAIQNAGPDVTDVTAYSIAQARLKAKAVGELNGVYIDKDRDVSFGQRTLSGGVYTTTWGATPPNVVKVKAHRDKADASLPDAQLKLFFSGLLGSKNASLVTSAAAYVESRDIVCVLDFSASMNDDSTYATLETRDRTALETNMLDIYNILDGLHDFGDLQFEPEWLTQTASSGEMNGSVVFRKSKVDINTSHNITSVKINSNSPTTYLYSAGVKTLSNFGSGTINRVETVVQFQDWGAVASASNTTSGKTATVTFNGTSVDVTGSSSMSKVKLIYYPSGSKEVNASGTTASVNGNGSYISNVQVRIGSNWVTVNNPNGSSPEIVTETLVFEDNIDNVKAFFGLDDIEWPWDSGSWYDFVSHCRDDNQLEDAGYERKYGGKCLVNYLLTQKPGFSQCEDLWRTPHYPFHSLKQGANLFAQFLDDLSFGDQMGMVSYATTAVDEHTLDYDGYTINMSSDPINDQFSNFKAIINHKQAGHYNTTTNIGGGLKQGKLMLDSHKRPGTQPTILLMTDGLANVRDTSYSLPGNWSWSTLFDYDGDGDADYSTSDDYCKYALGMAKQAVDAGYTIHTIGVGVGADNDLLEAIAWMGKGVHIEVPGDMSVAEMEEEVLEAFNQIAAFVPPARLVQE